MSKIYRKWQSSGIEIATDLMNRAVVDMSVAAGVGSGKTYLASSIAAMASDIGHAEQIIVVTINRRCQKQWQKEMKLLDMPLMRLNSNSALAGGLPPDVSGYITTYAGMGKFPDLHAAFCGSKQTVVIFDEVHHLNENEDTKWGKAAKDAFESAVFRLCLSGTFFSSNGARIPFAKMVPVDGANDVFEYRPDISYSYGDSVADGICRRIIFKPFDGPIEYKREDDDRFRVSTFADVIDPKDLGLRLWSACQVKSVDSKPNTMLEELLFQANRKLMDLRAAGHDRAGGLIACNDKMQARQMLALIEKISGHKAVLVLDDEPGSDKAIDSFAHGFAPWMVAIRMVTEGVDIPRLRVGVYLSNVVQKLTFVQFIGRMVRHFKGDENQKGDPAGEGYVYFPGDDRLQDIATEIEQEVMAAINLRDKQPKSPGGGGANGGRYQAGEVHGVERDNLVAGEMYSADEIDVADRLRSHWPNLVDEQIIDMVKFVRAAKGQPQPQPRSPFDLDSEEDDHESLRKACQKEVQRLARTTDADFSNLHRAANEAVGIVNLNTATIEQLKAKRAWLREQNGGVFDD